jgi:hypothetical protein
MSENFQKDTCKSPKCHNNCAKFGRYQQYSSITQNKYPIWRSRPSSFHKPNALQPRLKILSNTSFLFHPNDISLMCHPSITVSYMQVPEVFTYLKVIFLNLLDPTRRTEQSNINHRFGERNLEKISFK